MRLFARGISVRVEASSMKKVYKGVLAVWKIRSDNLLEELTVFDLTTGEGEISRIPGVVSVRIS